MAAQWVDLGYRDYRFLEPLIERFARAARRRLSAEDYLRLRMAEAFCDLAKGESDPAITALESALKWMAELGLDEDAALAHFWKGRAHRKKGEYETSLEHIRKARELAERRKDRLFTALVEVQESWLVFQKGTTREALEVLGRAEAVLKTTDHYVALGNIESARGRIVRRLGEYTTALEHFARATDLYARCDRQHLNLARTLVNVAYTRRLMALEVRKRIDRLTQPRGQRVKREGMVSGESLRLRYQELSRAALGDLKGARGIYELHRYGDGIGNVSLNLGYLHLDRGEIALAAPEAAEAYRVGVEKGDHILMARARILQAAIENALVEEETVEDAAVHAKLALKFSVEALDLAKETQNHRLVAGAAIARGMTAANDVFEDWEEARKRATEATRLIGPGENDYLVENLARLKTRVVQASGINDTLRGWSEGMVGSKTFQQVSEEFAEIVIPKVWAREGKRIARVATRLSISPKKVRRILRNAGLAAQE